MRPVHRDSSQVDISALQYKCVKFRAEKDPIRIFVPSDLDVQGNLDVVDGEGVEAQERVYRLAHIAVTWPTIWATQIGQTRLL